MSKVKKSKQLQIKEIKFFFNQIMRKGYKKDNTKYRRVIKKNNIKQKEKCPKQLI